MRSLIAILILALSTAVLAPPASADAAMKRCHRVKQRVGGTRPMRTYYLRFRLRN